MQKLYYQFPKTWFWRLHTIGRMGINSIYIIRDTRKPGPFWKPFWLGSATDLYITKMSGNAKFRKNR